MQPSFITLLAISAPLVAAAPSLRSRADAPQCGIRGWDKGNPGAYFYSTNTKYASLAACAARCALDYRCVSSGFGDGTCLGYKSALAGNVDVDAEGTYLFFDAACFVGQPPATPSGGASTPSPSSTPTGGSTSGSTCGATGYDKNKPTAFTSAKAASLDKCKALCASNVCKSYAYGKGNCYLYSAAVASNFAADSKSPYAFYDTSCSSAAPAAAPAESAPESTESTTESTDTTTTTTDDTDADDEDTGLYAGADTDPATDPSLTNGSSE